MLSAAERAALLAIPQTHADLIRTYTFSEADLAVIRRHRGAANRLGFAVMLSYMRWPGVLLGANETPANAVLQTVAGQLNISLPWNAYAQRHETRREHLQELQRSFGFQTFTLRHYHQSLSYLEAEAAQTDKGIVLATALVAFLRNSAILLPSMPVLERICAQAITRANKRIYRAMTEGLTPRQRHGLDALLERRDSSSTSTLAWLRQSPSAPSAKHLLEHVERLRAIDALALPVGIEQRIHQNRLLKIAREGAQMTAQHLRDLQTLRRHATLVAIVLETRATLIDELVDWHDRMIGKVFNRAKHSHEERFQQSGKAINEKVRLYSRVGQALVDARRTGADPFAAIETVIPWVSFERSVAEAQSLAQPEAFDFLELVAEGYTQIRRYAPALLDTLELRAAPAARDLLEAVQTLKLMNAAGARKLPKDAPTAFVRRRWEGLVFTNDGLDRRSYELCALSELRNALRSGDVWVEGSRQFQRLRCVSDVCPEILSPKERRQDLSPAR